MITITAEDCGRPVPPATLLVLAEIIAERARQNRAHPNDNCAQRTIHNSFKLTVLVEEIGEVAEALQRGCLDTAGRAHLREELIQVAAVAVAWAESLTECGMRSSERGTGDTTMSQSDFQKTCCVCGAMMLGSHFGACPPCRPVWMICFTSADEAARISVPNASLDTLRAALKFERGHSNRTTLVKAIARAIRKKETEVTRISPIRAHSRNSRQTPSPGGAQ